MPYEPRRDRCNIDRQDSTLALEVALVGRRGTSIKGIQRGWKIDFFSIEFFSNELTVTPYNLYNTKSLNFVLDVDAFWHPAANAGFLRRFIRISFTHRCIEANCARLFVCSIEDGG